VIAYAHYLKSHLPAPKRRGRPRIHGFRKILDAVYYVLRSDCAWRFYGWGALQACLPEKDRAFAASATLKKDAKVGLNGGQMVFEEIAAVLAPGHPPLP
jgi:transposase